jgi:hypothetical protein
MNLSSAMDTRGALHMVELCRTVTEVPTRPTPPPPIPPTPPTPSTNPIHYQKPGVAN